MPTRKQIANKSTTHYKYEEVPKDILEFPVLMMMYCYGLRGAFKKIMESVADTTYRYDTLYHYDPTTIVYYKSDVIHNISLSIVSSSTYYHYDDSQKTPSFWVKKDAWVVREVFEKYRYGFNGMEKDDEVKGQGNSNTTEFRQYDSRLGRWLSIDPKMSAWESPYVSMGNNPIIYSDLKGDTIVFSQDENNWRGQQIKSAIQVLRAKSPEFDYLYSFLEKSETVYTVSDYDLGEDISGLFGTLGDKGHEGFQDNMILLDVLDFSQFMDDLTPTVAEEFFHAYQKEIYGDEYEAYSNTIDMELEAKLFRVLIQDNIGIESSQYGYVQQQNDNALNNSNKNGGAPMVVGNNPDYYLAPLIQNKNLLNNYTKNKGLVNEGFNTSILSLLKPTEVYDILDQTAFLMSLNKTYKKDKYTSPSSKFHHSSKALDSVYEEVKKSESTNPKN